MDILGCFQVLAVVNSGEPVAKRDTDIENKCGHQGEGKGHGMNREIAVGIDTLL